jgi:hypothetical protein
MLTSMFGHVHWMHLLHNKPYENFDSRKTQFLKLHEKRILFVAIWLIF